MERTLITGAAGFVARHFVEYLTTVEPGGCILGIDIAPVSPFTRSGWDIASEQVDLVDSAKVAELVAAFRPTRLLHLASFSSVAYSWEHPTESLLNNTNIFLNIIEGVRKSGCPCRVLSVGSSEEYGNVPPEEMPLCEDHSLAPLSPYAVARVSQEMLSRIYVANYGLDVVLTRSFNHIGPYQSTRFVIASFIEQILAGKRRGEYPVAIRTGNLEIVRDFTDVRDVVRAYHLLFGKGRRGEVYNVCSGTGRTLRSLVETIAKLLDVDIRIDIDPARIRPSDNAVIIGSFEKIHDHTGWTPESTLERTLGDMIEEISGR